MGLRTLLLIATLAGTAGIATAPAAQPAASDGLARVPSKALSEFYVRPNANLVAYRKVQLAPARVEFERGWLKRINETRDVTRWISQDDVQRIAGDAATSRAVDGPSPRVDRRDHPAVVGSPKPERPHARDGAWRARALARHIRRTAATRGARLRALDRDVARIEHQFLGLEP